MPIEAIAVFMLVYFYLTAGPLGCRMQEWKMPITVVFVLISAYLTVPLVVSMMVLASP